MVGVAAPAAMYLVPRGRMASVFDRVKSIIIRQLGVGDDRVGGGSRFADDLGVDSIDFMELLIAFEIEFGIEIVENDARRIGTVSDLVSFIDARLPVKQ